MSRLVRIKAVEPLQSYVVRLTFTDGAIKDVDLQPLLRGPVFEPICRDRNEFLRVFVDPESETIAWPNGADLDPDVLYKGLKPAWMEDDHPSPTPPGGRWPRAIDLSGENPPAPSP